MELTDPAGPTSENPYAFAFLLLAMDSQTSADQPHFDVFAFHTQGVPPREEGVQDEISGADGTFSIINPRR